MTITIIGYSYEADTHCQECAEKRFGATLYSNTPVQDNEGNDVHPMYSYEEHRTHDDDACFDKHCNNDDDYECNDDDCKYIFYPTCGDCFKELS
jgi:hypothetical protein